MNGPQRAVQVCTRCRVPKPLSREFYYRRRRSPTGFQPMCIVCTRAALDQADARRRAQRVPMMPSWSSRRIPQDFDDLAALIRTHADRVADLLFDAVEAGAPDVLRGLAEALPHPCTPKDAEGAPLEDYRGPDCILCDFAMWHDHSLWERLPAVLAAPPLAWWAGERPADAVPPPADAPT